jgi:hypothetical protein
VSSSASRITGLPTRNGANSVVSVASKHSGELTTDAAIVSSRYARTA